VLSLISSLTIGRFLYKASLPDSLLDIPNSRKIHTKPTPLVGGITIIFASIIVIILFQIYNEPKVQQYVIFSLYFFFIGLFDDLFRWEYKKKLLLQVFGIISFIVAISPHLTSISFSTFYSTNTIFNYILIGFWLLFIINAFNFFDGINFLAGSLAIVFFTSYSIYYYQSNELLLVSILLINIFAILGFLIYNRAPAKMFLGDAGSMHLGFTIAAFPFVFTEPTKNIDMTFLLIVVFILISDTTFVVFNRLIQNKSPFKPDKTHLHHQLLNLEFRNRYIVLIITSGAIIHSILAFKIKEFSILSILSILIMINFVFIIFPRFLPFIFKRYHLWGLKKIYDKLINILKLK